MFLGLFLAVASCSSDDSAGDAPTVDPTPDVVECPDYNYDVTVKAIIDQKCSYSGCHISGSRPEVFSSYAELEPFLTNGRVQVRTNAGTMPPSGAPNGALTNEELEILNCWAEQNYPEN